MFKFLKRLFTSELDRKPCDHGRVGTCSLCVAGMSGLKVSECEHYSTISFPSWDKHKRFVRITTCANCNKEIKRSLRSNQRVFDRRTYDKGYDV